MKLITGTRNGQYTPNIAQHTVRQIDAKPVLSNKVAVIISILILAILVLGVKVQELDEQLSNTQDRVMNTYTVKVYRWKSEYIQNGNVQFTSYDSSHYSMPCALVVMNQSGHNCIAEDDVIRYTPSFFEDVDTAYRNE